MSRALCQFAIRFSQRTRDQAVKSDPTALKKSLKDSNSAGSSKCYSGAADEGHKLKRAEESLRTVMYLSCWAPT